MYSKNSKHLFGVNPFYVCLFIISLSLFGPLITFVCTSVIGLFNSYIRVSVGAILMAFVYYMFGTLGLLMFKVACLYTLFNIFYGSTTYNKIVELKKSNEFLCIQDDIIGIETIGTGITNVCTRIKNYTVNILSKCKNHIRENYIRVNILIRMICDTVVGLFNLCNMVYLELTEYLYSTHKILYESKYDVYVCFSGYIYAGYMILKFASVLFTMNTLFGNMGMGAKIKQPTKEDTEQMIGHITDALTVMMSGFDAMGMSNVNSIGKTNVLKFGR